MNGGIEFILSFVVVYVGISLIKWYDGYKLQAKWDAQRDAERLFYETYKAQESAFWSNHQMAPLRTSDGDEFYLGSRFFVEPKEDNL